MKISYIPLFILFLFPTFLFGQKDTIGQFSFTEKVRSSYYQTSQPIWQNKHGDFYIKLSGRKLNIYLSFGNAKKAMWLDMIRVFEQAAKETALGAVPAQKPLLYPITGEIGYFSIFDGEEYMASRPRLNFTFVGEVDDKGNKTKMLVVDVPKLQDTLEDLAFVDGFSIYLTEDEVTALRQLLEKVTP